MKNIVRIASAFLALVSVQAFASDCYIHAQVSSTKSKARIVLDVVRVDVPYFSPDNARMQLNQPEADNLQARALAYAKANAKRAEGGADTSAGFDKVSLSYGASCFRDEIRAEEMRAIDVKGSSVLHGSWSSAKLPLSAQASPATAKAANSSKGSTGNLAILTRSPDSSKQTPEELAAQKKRKDDFKRAQDTAAAAARSKAAKDASAAKALEDKQRQICMRPEHRGDCGCGRFLPPDPKRTVCSK